MACLYFEKKFKLKKNLEWVVFILERREKPYYFSDYFNRLLMCGFFHRIYPGLAVYSAVGLKFYASSLLECAPLS